ncbi:MAG: hypothetical protein ACJ8FY_11565 [Gemmataceae bacterium]
MDDYQIEPNTRRCSLTDRVLAPGEKYHSVILQENGRLVRHDYSEAAWPGLPPDVFGYWTGHVPDKEAARKLRKDDDLLFDCLGRLESAGDAKQLNFRYVVALLLLRSKKLKFEDTRKQDGLEFLRLRNPKTGDSFEVLDRRLSEAEIDTVREEVFQVVGWE